jgi:hypothetical protein
MLDAVYQAVQELMNKEQLGYFKPKSFNLFAPIAQRSEYNSLFVDLKLNERKQNWHLDERDLANLAEHSRQLLEHFSVVTTVAIGGDPPEAIPTNIEFYKNIFISGTGGKELTKVPYGELKNLERNIYAAPTLCSPVYAKVGTKIEVRPTGIGSIEIHYLRQPLTPKWTFVEDANGKPFFDPTALDYQDFDLPPSSMDRLVNSIAEMAGVSIRDGILIQNTNQNESQEVALENRQ